MSRQAWQDNWSYYSDARVLAGMMPKPRLSSDRRHIIVTLEDEEGVEVEHRIPARFEVCPTCDGRGSHVNPAIDAGGLTGEDFLEDPDFHDDYVRGVYDEPCRECSGERVVPVPDWTDVEPELRDAIERRDADDRAYARQCAAERRMGA